MSYLFDQLMVYTSRISKTLEEFTLDENNHKDLGGVGPLEGFNEKEYILELMHESKDPADFEISKREYYLLNYDSHLKLIAKNIEVEGAHSNFEQFLNRMFVYTDFIYKDWDNNSAVSYDSHLRGLTGITIQFLLKKSVSDSRRMMDNMLMLILTPAFSLSENGKGLRAKFLNHWIRSLLKENTLPLKVAAISSFKIGLAKGVYQGQEITLSYAKSLLNIK